MVNERCFRFSPIELAANMKIILNSIAARFSCYHVENIRKHTRKARYQGTRENNYTNHYSHTSEVTKEKVQKFVLEYTIKIP